MNTIISNSPKDTTRFAEILSEFVGAGDVIILSGELAAGKTHFVTSIARAFGSQAAISSPTYTIAHHYPTDKCSVLHIDAYRLSGADEFRDLTLEDYFEQSLVAVEWGDIIDGVFSDFLKIEFNFSDDSNTSRRINISFQGDGWRGRFPKIAHAIEEAFS